MSQSKYWSFGTLKSRGWTNGLVGELLEPPRFHYANGRRIRVWPREAVLTAEQSERFRTVSEAARARQQAEAEAAHAEGTSALDAAIAMLRRAWEQTARPEGDAALLAARWHEALCRRITQSGWAERLRPAQARGCVERFLALEKDTSAPVGKTLRHLATAAPWLGRGAGGAPCAERLKEQYGSVLLTAAERETAAFHAAQPEAKLHEMLMLEPFPYEPLLAHPLSWLYSVHYVPQAIRTSLSMLAALNPKDEYPQARAMQRHFVLHLGGTNTGKTYAGFQRLKQAATGVYLAPLRLLALEAQETLLDAGVDCSLTTGEEEDSQPEDTHVAATAEKLDLTARYEVAVIDECQMIADRQRGYAWTRAILGVLAPEVHLCAAPHAEGLLLRLIRSCGDSFEIVRHERKTPLVCLTRPTNIEDVRPGDALITFSKVGVLSVAEELRRRGKEAAIIYGALPYSARRRQMEGFLRGDMRYVVATDAIGMGLNLPIRRIIFLETEKFDGVERRPLRAEEIQQIAGRAGRFGMYDCGYVGAAQQLSAIRAGLQTVVPPLEYAVTGFSDLIVSMEFDLLEVLDVWNRMPTVEPYRKLDVSRYLSLISQMREHGFHLTREQELRAANIPFDETDEALRDLFYRFLRVWQSGQPIERPALAERQEEQYTLPELELYCRKLDLYFSFSKAFSCEIDRDALYDEREKTAARINEILLHNLKNNIRFCAQCGAALPLRHSGRLCQNCYRKAGRKPGVRPTRG